MPTTRQARQAIVLLLVAAVLSVVTAGPGLAGKGDKASKGGKEDAKPGPVAAAAIGVVDGDRYKMAQARMADQLTRIADDSGDQVLADGTPAVGAEAWSDLVSVHLAPVKVPRKLLTKMDDDFPRGAVGAFYGSDADWQKLERAIFVAVELAEKRPPGAVQQVEVGLDGDAAAPLQVGAASDTRAGLERFSLSGTFSNGSESSGTTDISGRRLGEAIEYYNTASEVFGFYDPRKRTYFLIMPLPSDAQSVSVALRSVTPDGEVIDRLELPGGGQLVPLADPASGWDAKSGTAPLACRSLETFGPSSGQPGLETGTTRIRYAAGVDPALDPTEAGAILAALDDAGESLALTLRPAGDDATSDQPVSVDAALSRAPGLNAFTLTMDVPPGQWTFEAADEGSLVTPAGEALIDASSLVGRAGVRTGDGLDGFVAGDPGCARFELGVAACDLVPADALAGLVGIDSSEVEQGTVARSDGAQWCVGKERATGEVQYIARFGTSYLTSAAFAAEVTPDTCSAESQDLGAEGILLDCGAQGFERRIVRVLPEAIAARDPDGGSLLSVDMLVDGGKSLGERYDADAAAALFEDLVAAVASSARPAEAQASPGEPAPQDEPTVDG